MPLKEEMAPENLKKKPRISASVKETEDGKILYGGVEVTESELSGDMSRIEKMRQKNVDAQERARKSGAPSDLREMMRRAADLAMEGQRETYSEGNEILNNRRLKKDSRSLRERTRPQ